MEQIRQVYDYLSSDGKYIFKIIKEMQLKKFKVLVYDRKNNFGKISYRQILEESYPTELDCILRTEELDNYPIILENFKKRRKK